jgi:pyruvate dehydrogenase E1 component alpha subunit
MGNKIDLLEVYKSMYRLRRAETVIAEYYFNNKIFSFVHFYIGQEAVAVGVSYFLKNEDRVFGNHRSHGHYLAKGGSLGPMFAEMLGKSTGCCKGKGGSMHMLDRSVGFMGSTPILASAAPIATGSAMEQKMSGSSNITVVFVGDGAAEEGVFYESLNFASVFKLPILFVIENNLYSVNTPRSTRKSENHSYRKICEGFDLDYFEANGNQVENVISESAKAINSIKFSDRPAVLECTVFRHMAHSAPIKDDKAGYRIIDTEIVRMENDSVTSMRNSLCGDFSESEISELEEKINLVVESALVFAIESPEPDKSELLKGIFV